MCLHNNYPTSSTQGTYEKRQVLYSFRDDKIEAQRDWWTCSRLDGLLISEDDIAFKEFFSSLTVSLYCSGGCLRPSHKLYIWAASILESSQSSLWDWSVYHPSGLKGWHHFLGSFLFHISPQPPGLTQDHQLYTYQSSSSQWLFHLIILLVPVSSLFFDFLSSGYQPHQIPQHSNYWIFCLFCFFFFYNSKKI